MFDSIFVTEKQQLRNSEEGLAMKTFEKHWSKRRIEMVR